MFLKLICTNIIGCALIIQFGYYTSHTTIYNARLETLAQSIETTSAVSAFNRIAHNNLILLAYLLLGSVSFGIISILTLCWNSYFIGTQIHNIITVQSNPPSLLYFYIILEFLSICIAASSGEKMGINLFQYICLHKKPQDTDKIIFATTISILLILGSSFLESIYLLF